MHVSKGGWATEGWGQNAACINWGKRSGKKEIRQGWAWKETTGPRLRGERESVFVVCARVSWPSRAGFDAQIPVGVPGRKAGPLADVSRCVSLLSGGVLLCVEECYYV